MEKQSQQSFYVSLSSNYKHSQYDVIKVYHIKPDIDTITSIEKLADIIKNDLDPELTWLHTIPYDIEQASLKIAELMLARKRFSCYGSNLIDKPEDGEYMFPVSIFVESLNDITVID